MRHTHKLQGQAAYKWQLVMLAGGRAASKFFSFIERNDAGCFCSQGRGGCFSILKQIQLVPAPILTATAFGIAVMMRARWAAAS
jgi:hypothetical protein